MSQRTHVCHVQKGSVSDASRLLDLGGLAVDRIESDTFGGRVVHLVTVDECASACPSCGVLSVSLKGLVCTRPRDIPYGTKGFAADLAQTALALQGETVCPCQGPVGTAQSRS